MRKPFERLIVAFSWCSFLFLSAILLSIFIYIWARGGSVIGSKLIFGDVPPLDGLFMHQRVFDGIFPAIAGTFVLLVLAVGMAIPTGLAAGIFMAEYGRGGTKKVLSALFDVLAGLPSIVVGLAGFSLTLFLHKILPNRIGPCLLVSACALSFLILPYLVRSTQMALEAIPLSLRYTAPAMGATRLQNIFYVLLPGCLPDILGGVLLALGRAAEDTAVIMLTGVVISAGLPRSLFEQFEALPFYIYYISSQYANPEELQMGFGAALVLLVLCGILFVFAFLMEQYISWRLLR
jgi:phosphate transport system permease protein